MILASTDLDNNHMSCHQTASNNYILWSVCTTSSHSLNVGGEVLAYCSSNRLKILIVREVIAGWSISKVTSYFCNILVIISLKISAALYFYSICIVFLYTYFFLGYATAAATYESCHKRSRSCVKNGEVIIAIEFEKCVTNTNIFGVSKLITIWK